MDPSLEIKVQMKIQQTLIESCFNDCVNSFKEERMTNNEKTCISNCGTRFMHTMAEFGR